jgi:hypothetical protein
MGQGRREVTRRRKETDVRDGFVKDEGLELLLGDVLAIRSDDERSGHDVVLALLGHFERFQCRSSLLVALLQLRPTGGDRRLGGSKIRGGGGVVVELLEGE